MVSENQEKINFKHEGGCFCNAVKFTVTADSFWSSLCYCKSCTKISSAPVMAWAGFFKNQVNWTGKEVSEFNSSKGVQRGFCKKCGSTLSYCGEKFGNDKIFIATVAFKNPNLFPPTEQVFTCESLDWMNPNNKIPKFDKLR